MMELIGKRKYKLRLEMCGSAWPVIRTERQQWIELVAERRFFAALSS